MFRSQVRSLGALLEGSRVPPEGRGCRATDTSACERTPSSSPPRPTLRRCGRRPRASASASASVSALTNPEWAAFRNPLLRYKHGTAPEDEQENIHVPGKLGGASVEVLTRRARLERKWRRQRSLDRLGRQIDALVREVDQAHGEVGTRPGRRQGTPSTIRCGRLCTAVAKFDGVAWVARARDGCPQMFGRRIELASRR
eukprot:9411064-Pyramimonas_sp.AAC.2